MAFALSPPAKVLGLALAGFVVSGCAAKAAAAQPAPPAQRALVAPALQRQDIVDLGRATASVAVRIAVTFNYRNQAELDQLVALQSSPGSPLYGHFLSPAQFAAEFAPSPDDYGRVVDSLQAAGFRVGTYSNRTVVDAIASAPVAERYFATEIHAVRQRGYGTRYANALPATIPAALGSVVGSVLGLDNVVKFQSQRLRAAEPSGMRADAIAPSAIKNAPASLKLSGPTERTTGGIFEGLYPTGIAQAYNYPVQGGYTGTGHPIAVVIDSDIANGDLTTFWKAAGITRTGKFNRILVEGTSPGINGDVGETAIDTETTSSLAPGSDIDLFLIPSLSDQPTEDAYNQAISAGVDVVSSSFGGCELDDAPFDTATNKIAQQAAAEGVTFTASTGDAGGYCEDSTAGGTNFYEADIVESPASDPYFLAIGGTTLTINATTGARTGETAWNPGGPSGGGGGGVSSFWPLPSYQKGVGGMALVPAIKATPPAPQPKSGFAGRNLPDVSLDASNGGTSFIAVYDTPDGGWVGYGGTSVANPLFAALVAEHNQKNKSKAGFFNPTIYYVFTAKGAHPGGVYGGFFNDITSGGIGAGWTAKAGYDQATGTGSVFNGSY
jgi:subtilase family serine protease